MRIQKTLVFASLLVVPFLTGCGMWRQNGVVNAPQAYSTPPAYTLPQQQPVLTVAPQVAQAPPQIIQMPAQQPIMLQPQQQVLPANYYAPATTGNACCNPCACQ